MEMTYDGKYIATHDPLGIPTIGIPSKQNIVLMSRDPSTDSLSKMQFCPAYRFCKELKKPYIFGDHDQQIAALHLLQAIKESAIRLIQLIVNDIEERWKRDPKFQRRYPESRRYERSDQQRDESKLILATTPSSVCALCGVALHLKNPSKKSEKLDRKRKDYHNRNRNIMMKTFNNVIFKMAQYKATLSTEQVKGQREIISKTQSIDTIESEIKSKLLFLRQISSDRTTCQICRAESQQRHDNITQMLKHIDSGYKYNVSKISKSTKLTEQNSKIYISPTISSTQDASTFTNEMFCPCACGLLVKDETRSEVSIISLPILKENLIKTKLEELSFYLSSNQTLHSKMYDDMQKLKKDVNIDRWRKEVIQLHLQTQVEELQKNIQFFKQENKYIRQLIEKCRCSLKTKFWQELLPITISYSGFTSAIRSLLAKYYNIIVTTLTEIFRGLINIQQIAGRFLTPYIEHWHRHSSSMIATSALRDESSFGVIESPSSSQYFIY
ncbi:uncharacterized protein LOC126857135 [Cataglyphis hispanica]|uniref:uncharacterized protein LOC126857135 n=1 Tax=Cataglyphis hispanica TaxID=1086592 RepID=UPI00217F9646|nr:uncharacterized protein LOC126857135 [Cataglyphis hispanica]